MAYIIENSVILSAMSQKLKDIEQNVHMMYNSQINDINFSDKVSFLLSLKGNIFSTQLCRSNSFVYRSLLML